MTMTEHTNNVTSCHQGPKRKLPAGYRAPSLQRMSCCDYFSSSSVVSCAFSVICVYSKFRHHPHPLGYLCAKFHFFHDSIAELAHGEKPRTPTITHPAYLMSGNRSLHFGKSQWKTKYATWWTSKQSVWTAYKCQTYYHTLSPHLPAFG